MLVSWNVGILLRIYYGESRERNVLNYHLPRILWV